MPVVYKRSSLDTGSLSDEPWKTSPPATGTSSMSIKDFPFSKLEIDQLEALLFSADHDQESFDYTATWINERIEFLDIYFDYNPTGISEISGSGLTLYPNPVHDKFWIDFKPDLSNQPYQIIDISGKVTASGIYNGNPIPVYGIEKGLYIFKLGNLTEKIIIQ